MERKFYTDDFEQLLKEKSDEFRMYPSKRVWHSIYNDLHPGRKWPSVAVSILLVIVLLLVGYWNNNSTETVTAASSKNNTTDIADIAGIDNKASSSNAATSYIASFTNALKNTPAPITALHTERRTEKYNTTANNSIATFNTALASINIKDQAEQAVAATTAIENNTVAIAPEKNNISPDISDITISNLFSVIPGIKASPDQNFAVNKSSIVAQPDDNIEKNNVLYSGTVNSKEIILINTTGGFNNAKTATGNVANNDLVKNKSNKALVSGTINSIKAGAAADATANLFYKDKGTSTINAAEEANALVNTENLSADILNTNTINKNIDDTNAKDEAALKSASATDKKIMSVTNDKAWIEDYAFHNKSKRKKWQDRTALGFYITPSVGFSSINNDPKYNAPGSTPSFTGVAPGGDANKSIGRKPGLGFEAGFSINYSLAKNITVKAGLQANYTNYAINANETNHPIQTTLMLLDPNSGYPYMHSAISTLSNTAGYQPVKIHNKTYQVSIPVGFALKLSGNDKIEWYAGATIQPSFVVGGKAYLISADRKNYVADASLIRKWNLNAGFESYINYKLDGFTLQAGPQFRYQMLSTYYKKYTVSENLSNIGIKIGILKNF